MGNESQKMGQEDIGKTQRGQCGSCGLRMLFWGLDEDLIECVKCGSEHEVERGEALNLGTNQTTQVAWLVLVEGKKSGAGRASVSEN